MRQKTTTIRVLASTHEKLSKITTKNETYDDILQRMIARELALKK